MKFSLTLNYLKRTSLSNMIKGSMMAIAVMLVLVVGHNWASYENKKYKYDYKKVKSDLVEYQKQLVKREVTRSINYIQYIRSLSHERMMFNLSNRVDVAWNIAENIYNHNKGKYSDHEIKKMIIDAIRPLRIGGDNNEVFVFTLNGIAVLTPRKEDLEGKLCLSLHDSIGNYMVQKELSFLKEVDKGFINYLKPSSYNNDDSIIYKSTYVKIFKPYNWYFGAKEYISDFEKELKLESLNRLANVRYENEGYIFIQTSKNLPIMSNGFINKDNKMDFISLSSKERQKITEVAQNGGGYVEYRFHRPGLLEHEPKIGYVEYIKEWDWIVGSGFYPNEIDKLSIIKREELDKQRSEAIIRIIIALTAILFIGLFFTQMLVRKIKDGFAKFDKFFKVASADYTPIRGDELFFTEFLSLSVSANKMLWELKDIRQAFEKEHSLLRSVMNSIPDMIFLKDLEGRYVGSNEAFQNFLGINENDFLGKTDFELFDKNAAEFYSSNDRKIIKDGIPIRNEEWITFQDGSKRLYDTLKVLCHDSSKKIVGILCISRDITEKNMIQEKYIEARNKAEESDRLKTAFLANMSHEIRTPMNSIVGFSNLIAEGGFSSEEQTEYIGYINTAASNLLNLINDIIDIAKIESGQLTIKPEYINLSKFMEEIQATSLENLKRLDKKNISINYTIDPELSNVKILTDSYRLNQVLNNLLVNAIKFTKLGSINYGCTLDKNNLCFFVKDTGIGISEKDQALLFKRFRQVGEENGNKTGGTGLGLAISKHIIELMQGEIKVESEKGKGSLFSFSIPFYPLLERVDQTSKIINNWNDKFILVIESEDASFNYLKAVFSGRGAKLLRTNNLNDAFTLINQTDKIDLIYCQINVNDSKLPDFFSEVKLKFPDLPIIGQVDSTIDTSHYEHCDTIIAKPIKYHMLLETVAPFIKN